MEKRQKGTKSALLMAKQSIHRNNSKNILSSMNSNYLDEIVLNRDLRFSEND